MKFLNKQTVVVNQAGYLVEEGTNVPVNHEEFVKIQTEANYLVTLASKVKVADFKGKIPDDYQTIVQQVSKELAEQQRVYVEKSEVIATPITDSLKSEALAWLENKGNEAKTEKLNRIMQKYNTLQDFETFGLYFTEDKIVKLTKLYTIQDILNAVTILEPHLA